jgi:hypothetical protein
MKLTHVELDNGKVKTLKEQIAKHHTGIIGKATGLRKDLMGAPKANMAVGPYKNQWPRFRDPSKFKRKGKQRSCERNASSL